MKRSTLIGKNAITSQCFCIDVTCQLVFVYQLPYDVIECFEEASKSFFVADARCGIIIEMGVWDQGFWTNIYIDHGNLLSHIYQYTRKGTSFNQIIGLLLLKHIHENYELNAY